MNHHKLLIELWTIIINKNKLKGRDWNKFKIYWMENGRGQISQIVLKLYEQNRLKGHLSMTHTTTNFTETVGYWLLSRINWNDSMKNNFMAYLLWMGEGIEFGPCWIIMRKTGVKQWISTFKWCILPLFTPWDNDYYQEPTEYKAP